MKTQNGIFININSMNEIGYPSKIIIRGNQKRSLTGYINSIDNKISLISLNKNVLNLSDISIDAYNKRALRVGRNLCPGLTYTFKAFQDITVPISLQYFPNGGPDYVNIATITPENNCVTFEMPFFEGSTSLYADGNLDIIQDIENYKLQIEFGQSATEYEPQNFVSTTINLEDKRLYSLGDDYGKYDSAIIKNRNDGTGYADVIVEKYCKEKILFGLENWQQASEKDSDGRYIYISHLNDVLFDNNIFYAMQGVREDGGIHKFYTEFKQGEDGYADVYVHTTLNSVNSFKNKLQNNQITVVYSAQNSETEKIGEIKLPFINSGVTNMYIDTDNNTSQTSFDNLTSKMSIEYEQKEGESIMAEKKFLDLVGLGIYDEKIKAKIATDDAKVLADSKAYADSLGANYDPAGSAATAKTEAVAEAKTYTDGKDTEVRAYIGTVPEEAGVASVVAYIDKKTEGIASDEAMKTLEGRVTAAEKEIETLDGGFGSLAARINMMEGPDNGQNKTIRQIANEELAAQLIPEGAQESMDTLKEIADWIQQHPEDAAEMNTKITALEGKAHEHANKDVLDGITAEKITAWDAAEANAISAANTYTDGKIAEFSAITEEEINALFPVA